MSETSDEKRPELTLADERRARGVLNTLCYGPFPDDDVRQVGELIAAIRRETRLATLDEVYSRAGKIVPSPKLDVQAQHYGIASVREIVCELIAPMVKS